MLLSCRHLLVTTFVCVNCLGMSYGDMQTRDLFFISVFNSFVGQPFVKRFALCYRSVVLSVCLSCLSVTFVHCGQTVGRIKMKLGMQVGLSPGHILLDGDPAPLPQRGTASTQFLDHISCSQMAAWFKMPLGIELGLSPGDFMLDGDPAPNFSAHVYYSYCDFAKTLHSRYGFVQVQVLVLYMHFIFRTKV